MTIPREELFWGACFSSLQFDRLLTGELQDADAERLRAHVALCPHCTQALESLRSMRREALSPLRLVERPPPRRRWWGVAVAGAGLAAAASLLVVARPTGERVKGTGFALAMYVEHEGRVRRASPGETVAPGDAVRFAVTAPAAGYVAVLSVDPLGKGSIYFPAGARAEPVAAGVEVPLPLGTRLDQTVGEERIVALFCAAAVELEPVRHALERDGASFPDGCEVTRWSFVKR